MSGSGIYLTTTFTLHIGRIVNNLEAVWLSITHWKSLHPCEILVFNKHVHTIAIRGSSVSPLTGCGNLIHYLYDQSHHKVPAKEEPVFLVFLCFTTGTNIATLKLPLYTSLRFTTVMLISAATEHCTTLCLCLHFSQSLCQFIQCSLQPCVSIFQ